MIFISFIWVLMLMFMDVYRCLWLEWLVHFKGLSSKDLSSVSLEIRDSNESKYAKIQKKKCMIQKNQVPKMSHTVTSVAIICKQ